MNGTMWVLTICQNKPVGMSVRVFPKSPNQPNEVALIIILQFDFPSLFSADERLETGKFSKW